MLMIYISALLDQSGFPRSIYMTNKSRLCDTHLGPRVFKLSGQAENSKSVGLPGHSYESCQPQLYHILLIHRSWFLVDALEMAKAYTTLFPTPPLDECKAPIENVFALTPVPRNDGQVSVATNMS